MTGKSDKADEAENAKGLGWRLLRRLGVILFLYGGSLLGSVFAYVYFYQLYVPPHTLRFPVHFHPTPDVDGRRVLQADIRLDSSETVGQPFVLHPRASAHTSAHDTDKTGRSTDTDAHSLTAIVSRYVAEEERRSLWWPSGGRQDGLLRPNQPYDISLLLRYPDRAEMANLGSLLFTLRLQRRVSGDAFTLTRMRALRYDAPIVRIARQLLSLPLTLWSGEGSERTERVFLAKGLVDPLLRAGQLTGSVSHESPKTHESHETHETNESRAFRPISAVKVSISCPARDDATLLPLFSAELEIAAHFTGLRYFLFYWRVTAATVLIGGSTLLCWFIVSVYLLVELVRRRRRSVDRDWEMMDDAPGQRSGHIIDEEAECYELSFTSSASASTSVEDMPHAEEVAVFLGDLRRRRPRVLDLETDEDVGVAVGSDGNERPFGRDTDFVSVAPNHASDAKNGSNVDDARNGRNHAPADSSGDEQSVPASIHGE